MKTIKFIGGGGEGGGEKMTKKTNFRLIICYIKGRFHRFVFMIIKHNFSKHYNYIIIGWNLAWM